MADIEVKLNSTNSAASQSVQSAAQPQKPDFKPNPMSMKLKARRTLDGNILITEHSEMDIVIMPEKMKIVAFVRDSYEDTVYEAQNRLFKYLFKKGLISADSVHGGNVYGSMEAKMVPAQSPVAIDEMAVLVVGKFIEAEKPSQEYQKAMEDERIEDLTEPDEVERTELGKIPHAAEKGSQPIHQVRRYAYGL